MNRRYRVLRFVIRLMKGLALFGAVFGTAAWLLTGGVVTALAGFIPNSDIQQAMMWAAALLSLARIVGVLLSAAFLWGFAELFEAIADTSESSRATAIYLRRLLDPVDVVPQSLNGMWDDDGASAPVNRGQVPQPGSEPGSREFRLRRRPGQGDTSAW